jgi:hypothetical protein
MGYIRYWNVFDEQMYDGYLVKEKNGTAFVVHPYCYEWLKRINLLNELHNVNTWDMPSEKIILHAYPKKLNETWFLNFTLEKSDIPFLTTICNYFEYFVYTKITSLVDTLERALYSVCHSVPKEILNRLYKFTLEYFKNDTERIDALISDKIRKFL